MTDWRLDEWRAKAVKRGQALDHIQALAKKALKPDTGNMELYDLLATIVDLTEDK